MKLSKFTIKNFRSINNLTINFIDEKIYTICGSNNIGKTNSLRALDLFFSTGTEKFDVKVDIPYIIEFGTQGAGRKITLIGEFFDENHSYTIQKIFTVKKDSGKILSVSGKRKSKSKPVITDQMNIIECNDLLESFSFMLIEASNIDMPTIIAKIVNNQVLPKLDSKRKTQTDALKKMKAFIDSSQKVLEKVQKDIYKELIEFVGEVQGIDTDGWKIKILFPEFSKLREAISGMIDFTLHDKTDSLIDTKGSGMQRIILFSLIQYIIKKTPNVILAVDEPEAFLQPSLQRKFHTILSELAKTNNVILTTHSQHFMDLSDSDSLNLFVADYEKKPIARKGGKIFYKIETKIYPNDGYDKIQNIKQHLGITKNDGWSIMPYNILVEGDEDKELLKTLFYLKGIPAPNILVAGGVTKYKGYLSFLQEFCDDLKYKPIILAIFDHDTAGKTEYKKIQEKKYTMFELKKRYVSRYDSSTLDDTYDFELEDLIPIDIIIKAVNGILRKKGYKIIPISFAKKRTDAAYNKKSVLEFLGIIVSQINSSLPGINFSDENMKLYISKKSISQLGDCTGEIFSSYPELEGFITGISK